MMNNTSFPKLLVFLATTFLLFGCSEDDVLYTGDGGTGTGTTAPTNVLSIGEGIGDGFTAGNLEIKTTTVVANGSIDVSVFIVDSNNNLSTASNTVTFNSPCVIQGLASFISPSITTTTGIATATYVDAGCQVSDTIFAAADWDTLLTAYGDITIDSSGVATANTLRVGTGTGLGFTEGDIAITTPILAAGGSTLISVNLVDPIGTLLTSANTVTFTSDCEQLGSANFTTPIITTSNGTATTFYNASGCVGNDVISATVTVGTTDKIATGTVSVAAAAAGSIQFTSATPSLIALQGTGSTTGTPESSTISFTLLDNTANPQPVSNAVVNFALSSSIGGITLSNLTATSDANGVVSTSIQSGNVATSVRVSATIDTTTITSNSDSIVIATGPADQNSMSLAAEILNPRAWNVDGRDVAITVQLADRFNNKIQDGTAVLFTTELGSIDSTCSTINGTCSVNWTSGSPRGDAGRNTILATVVGEESFDDANGNGIYDAGETFDDLGEAYLDENENGVRDASERFIDFNGNTTWDAADGQYNGSGAAISTTTVRASLVMVMAEDTPAIHAIGSNGAIDDLCNSLANCDAFRTSGATIGTNLVGSLLVTFGGRDNAQSLPYETGITFSAGNGEITGNDSHTIYNATGTYTAFILLGSDTTPSNDGSLSAEIAIGDGGGTTTLHIVGIDDTGTFVAPSTILLGSGSDLSFVDQELATPAPSFALAYGESTSVSVNVVDSITNALITAPTTVTFSSTCAANGQASFSSLTVLTVTGTATTTYNPSTCEGPDIIVATSDTSTASGIVIIAPAPPPVPASIQFTSVSNTQIALKGTGSTTGLSENSLVLFAILDSSGDPVINEAVSFTLNSTIGGITLSQATATSDSNGFVTTIIQSGTVATSVRVTAVVDSNTALITTSDAIAIATGPADQNSMSLSAEAFNPRAWNVDGKTVSITARLADRFNNPIQDGTSVLFTTELGSIEATCTTVGGACSVNWTSQDPRGTVGPLNNAGRTTILATVEGEESFIDINANGIFDNTDTFTDLGEAYLDENENGSYDLGEVFTDFNGDGVRNNPDTFYNGSGCATNCAATNSISVRDSLVLVMAEDYPAILSMGANGSSTDLCNDFTSCQIFISSNPTLNTATASSVNVVFGGWLNEQTLPVGTTIKFAATNGKITSGSEHTVPNTTSAAQSFTTTFSADTTPSNDGVLTAEVSIGDGGGVFSFFIASIDDDNAVAVLQLGQGSGSGFVAGELEIKIPEVETGSSTVISAFIVDENNNLSTGTNAITFTSNCSLQGLASFSAANVITTTGIASTTYIDNGCLVSDTIIATADWDTTVTARGDVTIVPSAVTVRIGADTGAGFVDGDLLVTTPNLPAEGSTTVSVDLVDALGVAVTSPDIVTFSSTCEQAGTASFSSSSITNFTGTVSTTYTASGCSGTDAITATITVDGTDKTASGIVTVASALASSIQFDSVSDSLIALKGAGSTTGYPENSTVTFIILDSNGVAVANEAVTFSLDTTLGGITLSQATATSDSNGIVSTTIQSGTVATSVSITVEIVSNTTLSTTSSSVVIAVGPPDQDSMSLTVSSLNPRAWSNTTQTATVTVTARLADRFNNPVQDDTAILFKTELGTIQPSCLTVDGACSVEWTNTNPLGDTVNAGRNTILATAIGDESFIDLDANGIYDNFDTFTNLPEAFLDENENGTRDATEVFIDFDGDTLWDDGIAVVEYNGSSCALNCSTNTSINVRSSVVIVLAEDTPAILALGINGSTTDLCNGKAACDVFLAGSPSLGTNIADNIQVTLGGLENSQTLPAGTDVSFNITNGEIISGADGAVGNTTDVNIFYISIGPDADPSYNSTTDFLEVAINMGDGGATSTLRIIGIDDTGSAVAPSTISLGTGTLGAFVDGALDITTTNLSAGGSTAITVNVVDSLTGALDLTANTVTFSSACVDSGASSFDDAAPITITGTVTVTYTSSTCSGPDVITATSGTATASGTITVASYAAGSIQLTLVSNSLIALQGTGSTTGLPESSDITFTVRDSGGNLAANELINFSLDSSVGGITLASASATTDTNGQVIATVQSGTVTTSVRVTASVDSAPTLITTSSAIVIATGPPDQDSMSLSASVLNPRGWNWDGTDVTITARLADRFNNKIQDGTAISFTTELGSIVPSCTTIGGACSVIWTSQSPRGDFANAGRATILATVEGEESFSDNDGNGVFSDGDSFTDLPEAYRDDDESAAYNFGEVFINFDSSSGDGPFGTGWNDVSTTYNGAGCTHATLCDAVESITVRDSLIIVMAEDVPAIVAIGTNGATDNICNSQADCSIINNYPSSFQLLGASAVNSVTFTIAGIDNEQVLPVGSSVNFTATNGEVTAGASQTVNSTNAQPAVLPAGGGVTQYTVYLKEDIDPSNDGVLSISATVEGNLYSFPPIDIDDTLPPPTYTVSGNVTGTIFPGGTSLELLNNGGDTVAISALGAFAFPTSLLDTDPYAVTVTNNTTTLTCVITGGTNLDGTGAIATADVTDIDVACNP